MGATVILLMAAAAPPAGAAAQTTQVEQLAPAKPSTSAANVVTAEPVRPASVEQLPEDLRASDGSGAEDTLIAGQASAGQASAGEIARAYSVIRARGQVPTAELIAREVGPDVLQAYLETNPGVLADPSSKAPATPDPVKPLPGVVIIPPKG
jgi:hypothetical protein